MHTRFGTLLASALRVMALALALVPCCRPLDAQELAQAKTETTFLFLKCAVRSAEGPNLRFFRIPKEGQNIVYEQYFSEWNADERKWQYPISKYVGPPNMTKYKATVTSNIAQFEKSFESPYSERYQFYHIKINRRTGSFVSQYTTNEGSDPSVEGSCEIGQPDYSEVNKF